MLLRNSINTFKKIKKQIPEKKGNTMGDKGKKDQDKKKKQKDKKQEQIEKTKKEKNERNTFLKS